uniref:Glycosyl transferase CAP10 domain-containing protein n=1 Tax=Romanomermis culicivorax TaxID=13658 RepID=A0A915J0S1_ROMCU
MCRLSFDVLDLKNGSYIVRCMVHGFCKKLNFRITVNGIHLGNSPFNIEGHFNDDRCSCPVDLEKFYENLYCPNSYDQLDQDLSLWPKNSVPFASALDSALKRWAVRPESHSFCHYMIFDNKLYRKCHGRYVGFKMFTDSIFQSLLRKVKLPNTEFLFNLGDWPLEAAGNVPMMSWCGSGSSKDIVLPSYEITEATLEMMARRNIDIISILGAESPKWDEKIDRAIWRGRDSSQERLILVQMARNRPDLIEANITRFFFFRDLIDVYGPEVPHMPFQDFFKYKFVVNMDGTVAAYRFAFLLAGTSLVFKQTSNYYEHFYKLLKPWVHYVPVEFDLSDLIERIEWAKNNQEEAQKIVSNARKFVAENLLPSNILCYYAKTIQKYTELLETIPEEVPSDMEEVKMPNFHQCSCKPQDKAPFPKEEL